MKDVIISDLILSGFNAIVKKYVTCFPFSVLFEVKIRLLFELVIFNGCYGFNPVIF